MVAAALGEIFQADDAAQARERVSAVLEQPAGSVPKLCEPLEQAEEDLTGFCSFPRAHWPKIRSTNPLERVNEQIGRRSGVVGIFPRNAAAIRLAGALLLEQNDAWLVQRRYLCAESLRSSWPTRRPRWMRGLRSFLSRPDSQRRRPRVLRPGPAQPDDSEAKPDQEADLGPFGTAAQASPVAGSSGCCGSES